MTGKRNFFSTAGYKCQGYDTGLAEGRKQRKRIKGDVVIETF
jgi:hypothetical protein